MMRPYEVVDTDDNPTGPLNTLGDQASAEASNHGLWKSSSSSPMCRFMGPRITCSGDAGVPGCAWGSRHLKPGPPRGVEAQGQG